jgi:hypothetical protein
MWLLPLLNSPIVGIPSGLLSGHKHARAVDVVNASAPAPSRIGAGRDDQNHFSPALAEKRVKKSDTDTFR